VTAADLPGHADLARASFLARTLAGAGVGLKGRPFRDVLALQERMKKH
jgi:hypothetical protein